MAVKKRNVNGKKNNSGKNYFNFSTEKKKRIAGIFLILFSNRLFADFQFTENCQQAYTEVTSLRFQNAQILLQTEKRDNPSNDFPYLLENYIDFLLMVEKKIF